MKPVVAVWKVRVGQGLHVFLIAGDTFVLSAL